MKVGIKGTRLENFRQGLINFQVEYIFLIIHNKGGMKGTRLSQDKTQSLSSASNPNMIDMTKAQREHYTQWTTLAL
jgi:hypothetical protein